jgi:hypothetical protein
MERHSKKMADAWAKCEQFNTVHPVGTKVRYRSTETRTKSEAWAMPDGLPRVGLEGMTSEVLLAEVEVLGQ